MDITPLAAGGTPSLGATTPIAPSQPVAIEQLPALGLLPVAPTTVDLSTQGRFLSLSALFQKKTLALQASVDAHAETPQALAEVSTLAQALTLVFNELQTARVDNSGLPAGAFGQQTLAAQFLQQFGDPADETQANLERIGLRLDASPFGVSSLRVDPGALDDAFGGDPAATSALLVRAGNAFFGAISGQILSNTGNLDLFADDGVDNSSGLGPLDLPATQAAGASRNLVPDDVRNGNELPDDRAIGIALPEEVTSPATGSNVLSAQTEAQLENASAAAQSAVALSGAQRAAAPVAAAVQDAPAASPIRAADQAAALAPLTQPAVTAPSPGLAPALAAPVPDQVAAAVTRDAATDAETAAQETGNLTRQLQEEIAAARERDERNADAGETARPPSPPDVDPRTAASNDPLRQERAQRGIQEPATALDQARQHLGAGIAPATGAAPVVDTIVPASAVLQPPLAAPDQAQQLARDPATAAAIAAYYLNNGPFAAQQVKADALAPKVKLVPPVAGVTKVERLAALDTSAGGPQSQLP